ncbi:hypothetical protein HON01_03605, partial [Candidatus Woesearchaeota archaeon]|nr:hypothetical protein [Candidatus Woesearchaeota archaeon]
MEDKLLDSRKDYVGFKIRFLAYFVDTTILFIVLLFIQSLMGQNIYLSYYNAQSYSELLEISTKSLIPSIIGLFVGAFYFVLFWSNGGATPGKKLLGIKIVNEDGSKIDFGKAFLRFIGYFISGMVFYLGFLWVAFDSKKQGWHDKIVNTYVVKSGEKANVAVAILIVIMYFVLSFTGTGLIYYKTFSLMPDADSILEDYLLDLDYDLDMDTDTQVDQTIETIDPSNEESELPQTIDMKINSIESKNCLENCKYESNEGFTFVILDLTVINKDYKNSLTADKLEIGQKNFFVADSLGLIYLTQPLPLDRPFNLTNIPMGSLASGQIVFAIPIDITNLVLILNDEDGRVAHINLVVPKMKMVEILDDSETIIGSTQEELDASITIKDVQNFWKGDYFGGTFTTAYIQVNNTGTKDFYPKYDVMIKNTNTKEIEFEDTIYDVFNSKSVAGSTKTYTINIDADVYELAYYYIEMKLIDVDSNEE